MRDTTKEQWPSYSKPESKFTVHSRASSLGTSNNRSESKHNQNGNQVHQRCEISPPPLKRKRTAYEESHRGQDLVSVTSLSTRKSLRGQPCKPACRVCDKTTATSYNPIISCPGCARPYHDSCRRPPLPQGVDPQYWRCSACSNRSGKPSNPILLSKPVPVRKSVVKEIYAHNFRASTTKWLESLDKPKEDFESSLQSDRSENRSTPARCSNQSLHPECSSQQHHVQAQIDLSAPSSSIRVQSRTPVAPCSGCQQDFLVIRPDDENPQCQSCRSKSRVEIPETPNAAAPYYVQPLTSSAESAASPIVHSPTARAERSSWIQPNRTSTLDHTSTEPPNNEQQREKDHWKLGTSKTTQESKLPASGSPIIHKTEDTQIPLSPRRPHTPSTNDATVRISCFEQQAPSATSSESSPKAGNLSVPLNISTSPEVDDASSYMRQRHHTNRQLARIALACANGSSMSAPQIIDWLVRRFPYLQQGQALWEKSLKATLSLKDFCSHKANGLDDVRVVYSFANEAYKTRYEEEYRDYITQYSHGDVQQRVFQPAAVESTGDVRETIESIPDQHRRGHLGEAIENAPARHDKDIRGTTPKRVGSSQQSAASFIPSPASTSSDDNTSPRPFKPSKLSLARSKAEYAPTVKRETSFHKAYPHGIRTPLEMMTTEEKARKVAEIRARPSRKQLIDSGQRLAHVRRYGRQDPHDESDGAWKPQSVEVKEKPMEDAEDCDEPRSLRDVFRLPANAVPMLHEGNELAFRDGTMVNGRLPRPRRIYRVGKRLGAGLTVN